MKRRAIIIVCMFVLMLAAGAIAFYVVSRPVLIAIDPVSSKPNEVVSLFGRNFGEQPGHVLFDAAPLPSPAVLYWSPQLISIRMPHGVDTAIVRIQTRFGLSNPLMLADASKIPEISKSAPIPSIHPVISSMQPTTNAQIGKPLIVSGDHFGDPEEGSAVFFTRIASVSTLALDDPANFIEVNSADKLVEVWTENKITVRVPDGAENGFVFVRTKRGTSNVYPVSISRAKGRTWKGETAKYSIEQRIAIHVAASLPEGQLSLFLAKPPNQANQNAQIEVKSGAEYLVADENNWQEFRLGQADASKGKIEIVRGLQVDVSEMRADLASSSLQGIDSPWPAFLASSLAADTLVPSDDPTIQAAALAIQKKEKNPFRQIVLVSQWVSSNVKLNDKSQGLSDEALVALKHKAGGTRALALLNCAMLRALGIPAVPVAGFLATGDNRLIPHFWGEYYLTGMGWIPFDPLLASGYVPQQFSGGFSDRLIYYRGIDNRHIAMSRGYRLLPAVSREVQKKQKVSWSFFEYDELSLGLSYSSTWDIAMISWNANP